MRASLQWLGQLHPALAFLVATLILSVIMRLLVWAFFAIDSAREAEEDDSHAPDDTAPGVGRVHIPEDWIACNTGDCPHVTQAECNAWRHGFELGSGYATARLTAAQRPATEREALENIHACIGDADGIQLDRALREYRDAVRAGAPETAPDTTCDYWKPIRQGCIALPCSCGQDCDGLRRAPTPSPPLSVQLATSAGPLPAIPRAEVTCPCGRRVSVALTGDTRDVDSSEWHDMSACYERADPEARRVVRGALTMFHQMHGYPIGNPLWVGGQAARHP